MNLRGVLTNAAHQIKSEGLFPTIRSLSDRAQMRWNEWRFGIRTEGNVALPELGIYNEECKEYAATTNYADFPRIMRALLLDPREHVFLDYGAGMGRAMILAATYPFKRVVGVDIAPELTAIANDNFARCRSKLRCQDLSITTSDATLYEIPRDATLFYIANAFNGQVLAAVLRRIRTFAASAPTPVLLVCNVPARSAFEDQIRAHDWLTLTKELPLRHARRCLIFSASGRQSGA
jgi:hypothetical protein